MPYSYHPPASPTYIFECDICHGEIRVGSQSALVKCAACGKKLCTKCVYHGLCEEHFAQLPSEDREQLYQMDERFQAENQAVKQEMRKRLRYVLLCLCIPVGVLLVGVVGVFSIRDNYPLFATLYIAATIPGIWMSVPLYKQFKQTLTLARQHAENETTIIHKHFPAAGLIKN